MTDLPVACTLPEFALQIRRTGMIDRLMPRVQEIRPLEEGYALRFLPDDDLIAEVMNVIREERRCCAFLRFRLTLDPGNGPVLLELTGPAGTKAFLASMLEIPSPDGISKA